MKCAPSEDIDQFGLEVTKYTMHIKFSKLSVWVNRSSSDLKFHFLV